jgi:hypothetical protein
MKYKLFHKETGECMGQASSLESLGELFLDLYHDDDIFSHQLRVEEVEDESE